MRTRSDWSAQTILVDSTRSEHTLCSDREAAIQ
jgi:hypothetical protein